MTMNPVSGLVALARWLQQLTYNNVRRAEELTTFPIQGKEKKMLRAVHVAEDLYMARDRTFFKIIGGRAVSMPLSLVAEQYTVDTIRTGFDQSKKSQKKRRQSA